MSSSRRRWQVAVAAILSLGCESNRPGVPESAPASSAFDFRRLVIERVALNGTTQICDVNTVVGPRPTDPYYRQQGQVPDDAIVQSTVICGPAGAPGDVEVVFTSANQAEALSVREGTRIAVQITARTFGGTRPVARFIGMR